MVLIKVKKGNLQVESLKMKETEPQALQKGRW